MKPLTLRMEGFRHYQAPQTIRFQDGCTAIVSVAFAASRTNLLRAEDAEAALRKIEETPEYCEDDTQAVVSMVEIARAALASRPAGEETQG